MKSFKILFIALIMLVLIPSVHAASYDIVIARGDVPVDLLVAQVYTQKAGIPLVTVTKAGLTTQLKNEFIGYKEQGENALIIGGEAAVSKYVEESLESIGYTVTRLWDWDRYGTAARVAVTLWENSDTVVVTQGDEEGALISGARIAMDYECPLLLTETNELTASTKQAIQDLGSSRIILAGAVSQNVRTELSQLGGLEQTQFSQIERVEENPVGLFVIGAIVGALIIFLISTLWGAGIFKRLDIPYHILQEDEQAIIDAITHKGGVIKQQDLPEITSFSRPKVSRMVSELEKRGIIERIKAGKTLSLRIRKKLNR